MTFGSTDEFGHRAVENVVTPNDFHATLLHQFGLSHQDLVYVHSGQEQIVTNKRPARVVEEIVS